MAENIGLQQTNLNKTNILDSNTEINEQLNQKIQQENDHNDQIGYNEKEPLNNSSSCTPTDMTCSDNDVRVCENVCPLEDKKGKQGWDNNIEYLLSCISYGVGLGNLWRFPYLCYEHYGFTFLVPYWIFLICCGLPLCVLEGCLGQFAAAGPITVWRFKPMFEGVGWGQLAMCLICCVYYNVIVAYAIYYFLVSLPFSMHNGFKFTWTLPYDDRSDFCLDNKVNISDAGLASCAEYYYNTEILQDTGDFSSGLFSPNWAMVGTVIIAWLLIYYSQSKGAETTGKISYITSILPYVCLVALFICTIQLNGAKEIGIQTYMTINMTHLGKPDVWKAAAQQVFFSQGAAWGVLVNFAAHNAWTMDVYNHCWRLSVINALTSFFGGFVVFSTIGFLAYEKAAAFKGNVPHKEIIEYGLSHFDDVVQQTHKLAFVVYPVAITKMPWPTLWGILFFIMLATLGVGSQVGMFMCCYEGLLEKIGILQKMKRKFLIYFIIFTITLGYPMLTNSGIQWLNVFDWSVCAISIFLFAFMETVAISWFYGIDKFCDDIESMLCKPIPYKKFWKFLWKYVCPLICGCLVILNVYSLCIKSNWQFSSSWPWYANFIGWIIQGVQIAPIIAILYFRWDAPLNKKYFNNRDKNLNRGNQPLVDSSSNQSSISRV